MRLDQACGEACTELCEAALVLRRARAAGGSAGAQMARPASAAAGPNAAAPRGRRQTGDGAVIEAGTGKFRAAQRSFNFRPLPSPEDATTQPLASSSAQGRTTNAGFAARGMVILG